jgi:hypothetical protein
VRERAFVLLCFGVECDRSAGMLSRMFGTIGDGDHLLGVGQPVTGSYPVVPSIDDLVATDLVAIDFVQRCSG